MRYESCYTCGEEWKDKKATCSCPLWEERNIIHDDSGDDYYDEEKDDYYYEDDDENGYYHEEQRDVSYNQAYWHCDNGRARRPDNYYRRNY